MRLGSFTALLGVNSIKKISKSYLNFNARCSLLSIRMYILHRLKTYRLPQKWNNQDHSLITEVSQKQCSERDGTMLVCTPNVYIGSCTLRRPSYKFALAQNSKALGQGRNIIGTYIRYLSTITKVDKEWRMRKRHSLRLMRYNQKRNLVLSSLFFPGKKSDKPLVWKVSFSTASVTRNEPRK